MIDGTFVPYRGWNIWVWESMLDRETPTYRQAAKHIFKSGWLRENKAYVPVPKK